MNIGVKDISESPSGQSPVSRQDPLERRRLQNRLSQRNHRRKIRDRIAKLQERVIANELRAAAAFNGWDQSYAHSSLLEYRFNTWQTSPISSRSLMSSTCLSPSSTTPSISSISPYAPRLSYPTDSNAPQIQANPGKPSYLSDIHLSSGLAETSSYSPVAASGLPTPPVSFAETETFQDTWTSPNISMPSEVIPSNPLGPFPYYVATEATLPQVLQALQRNSYSPIVVVASPGSVQYLSNSVEDRALHLHDPSQEGSLSPMIDGSNLKKTPCECQSLLADNNPITHLTPQNWI